MSLLKHHVKNYTVLYRAVFFLDAIPRQKNNHHNLAKIPSRIFFLSIIKP